MLTSEFYYSLNSELELLKYQFPYTMFVPWIDFTTDTCVVTVMPDKHLETDAFAEAEEILCERMYELFPDTVITFRSKDDTYYPYPGQDKGVQYSGTLGELLNNQVVCSFNRYEGFESEFLVSEDMDMGSFLLAIMMIADSNLNPNSNENYLNMGESNYSLAA